MGSQIRQASQADAAQWLELVRATLGDEYPAKELYDPAWVACQLDPQTGSETWVVETDGRLICSASFLQQEGLGDSHIANLGRNIFLPESFASGAAEALIQGINQLATERSQMVVVRILARDNAQQILFENLGYVCVGYQPLKHALRERAGALFYVRGASSILVNRLPLSEELPQVGELAESALAKLQISQPAMVVRDGATGYPLQVDIKIHDASADDYDLWRLQAESSNPPVEISGRFNRGYGHMRLPSDQPLRAFLGQCEQKIVAGLAYYFDEHDRCVRIIDAFAADNASMGPMVFHALKTAEQSLGAHCTEIDILATATRLLKTAEQLGFVPVAYLPAFFSNKQACADVVKLIKLNISYALDKADFTAQAASIVKIVDHNFQQEKIGMAVINLLRPLPIFKGLGDGELRKIALLFTQKLYRTNDQVFERGDSSKEAYIILRGQIDIKLDPNGHPIAILGSGKIFGELAFLDGSSRTAYAVAAKPSVLLVVQRSAFQDLIHHEPHLGMVVMNNIALDLCAKLREADVSLKYHNVTPDV